MDKQALIAHIGQIAGTVKMAHVGNNVYIGICGSNGLGIWKNGILCDTSTFVAYAKNIPEALAIINSIEG